MTKLCYPTGCEARSQDCGNARSPSEYAWNVNCNNGNTNYNNQNNNGFVRAVCVSECRPAISFQALHTAWREARHGKQPSRNQLRFDSRWIDHLLELQARLNDGMWHPLPPTCFVAPDPKAREIHAPDFSDRIVHHWVVPPLNAIYEPTFIHDSYSNRPGKGTHAAVDRLRSFVREVHSGQGGGWYLQLDIHNFFNSIHRATLYQMLKTRMVKHQLSEAYQRAVHALLRHSPTHYGVHLACTEQERAQVPAHKQLCNAPSGCGIAIGNLSSQFFANVYLDALDQFVKHTLKAKRYLRYVDDFVLIHHDREQLASWQAEIEQFLKSRLRLSLKADIKLRPLNTGIDFLGYVVFPTHSLVRKRVIQHARAKLHAWQCMHVSPRGIRATPTQLMEVQATWRSYEGHFSHANSYRLRQSFQRRFPWLHTATVKRRFDYRLGNKVVSIPITSHAFA